jgi:hypothetical protein
MNCKDVAVAEDLPRGNASVEGPLAARRRRLLAAALALALGAGGGGWWLHRNEDALPRTAPHSYFILPPMDPGRTDFEVGELFIHEKGKAVEILRVEALTSANVHYLGAVAVWPRDLGSQPLPGVLDGYPTPEQPKYHPAFGVVAPAEEVDYTLPGQMESRPLVVEAGFRLAAGDMGGLNGIRLTYRVGNKIKRSYFHVAVIVCVKPNRCGGSGEGRFLEKDRGFDHRTLIQLGLVSKDAYEH